MVYGGVASSWVLNNYVYIKKSRKRGSDYEGLEISTKALYPHFMHAMMTKVTLALRGYVV